jgi:hypothetical protein
VSDTAISKNKTGNFKRKLNVTFLQHMASINITVLALYRYEPGSHPIWYHGKIPFTLIQMDDTPYVKEVTPPPCRHHDEYDTVAETGMGKQQALDADFDFDRAASGTHASHSAPFHWTYDRYRYRCCKWHCQP